MIRTYSALGALALLVSVASLVSLAGCASAAAPEDAAPTNDEGALVTTTSSAWSGVYDLAAAKDGDAKGSLHVYSLNKNRLILALHARAFPEGQDPTDGQKTIRISTPIPVVAADKALYAETTPDENLSPSANPAGCKVDIARQSNGDLVVAVTHCKNDDAAQFSFGPVRFVRRGKAADPYAGDYKDSGYLTQNGGSSLHVDPVASGASKVKMTLTTGSGSFPITGTLGKAGLVASIVDSSGCKGVVSFMADGVNIDPEQGDCAPASGAGAWSIDDLVETSFADPAAPTASDNYRTARRMPGG